MYTFLTNGTELSYLVLTPNAANDLLDCQNKLIINLILNKNQEARKKHLGIFYIPKSLLSNNTIS